ncbi:MAG: hypothetical protein WBA57_06680 [Elainellaceae cyanobacterium]
MHWTSCIGFPVFDLLQTLALRQVKYFSKIALNVQQRYVKASLIVLACDEAIAPQLLAKPAVESFRLP